MIYKNDNLIIEYSENDAVYINDIIITLSENSERIMNFFKLTKLNSKVRIAIWDSVDSYRSQLEPQLLKVGKEYKEWMIADTYDGNINMMAVSAVQTTKNREDYSLAEFLECVCHEFVHICQKTLKGNASSWIWEMLATNLGNPSNKKIIPIDVTLDELNKNFDNIKNSYSIAYTIGQYLFENCSDNHILKIVIDNNEDEIKNLFEKAKEWSFSKNIKKGK